MLSEKALKTYQHRNYEPYCIDHPTIKKSEIKPEKSKLKKKKKLTSLSKDK